MSSETHFGNRHNKFQYRNPDYESGGREFESLRARTSVHSANFFGRDGLSGNRVLDRRLAADDPYSVVSSHDAARTSGLRVCDRRLFEPQARAGELAGHTKAPDHMLKPEESPCIRRGVHTRPLVEHMGYDVAGLDHNLPNCALGRTRAWPPTTSRTPMRRRKSARSSPPPRPG